ncbi:hypothetical protein BWD42_09355 [Sphingobacterium sp. CZ-UAM]|uniref:hypothetical protein n=1 Tax=Sphingobacterium sp. CZ-UAM TaxID=1933868 RepID=UPI000986C553|nr:hypothetical protein [Sphingobacterium sp. CZ-UAM]OOG20066.1 hypothetical protein BWD42_09355 [Sphingobacterium sp. CZ-UAM]
MESYSSDHSSFLQTEIRKIKKIRNAGIGLFIAMFLLCYGFFFYVFLDKWAVTSDKLTFFYRSLPLLSTLFVYFGVLFGALNWVVYAKNQKFIIILRGLNTRDLDIYQRYTRRLVRIYASIAPYLFREHELIFFPFWGSKKIPISQIHRIETRIIRNHRGPDSFRIYFYNEFSKIHQVTMNQRGAFDFLQEQLLEQNPDLSIISKNH